MAKTESAQVNQLISALPQLELCWKAGGDKIPALNY